MRTKLAIYLATNGIKDAEFAPLIERDRSHVSKLRRGKTKPSLALAQRIERATKGQVPIAAWMTPQPARKRPTEQSEAA